MLNYFNMCVCGGGGGGGLEAIFMLLFYIMLFFRIQSLHQISFLPNKHNLEEYFHRQHFNANIFI